MLLTQLLEQNWLFLRDMNSFHKDILQDSSSEQVHWFACEAGFDENKKP